jgi:hypothetical protein
MLRRIHAWFSNRRATATRRAAAWAHANDIGADGLTVFEKQAIDALQPVTGALNLRRAGEKMPYLVGPIPNSAMTLYLYGDEAQVSGIGHGYRMERWDFESPEASISDLLGYVRSALQSDSSLERSK